MDKSKIANADNLEQKVLKELKRLENTGEKHTQLFNDLDLELTSQNAKKFWGETIKNNPLFP